MKEKRCRVGGRSKAESLSERELGKPVTMFEKTLQDVVKGIRANKRDPSDYISATIAEIKVELKTSDAFIKAQAVRVVQICSVQKREIREHTTVEEASRPEKRQTYEKQ